MADEGGYRGMSREELRRRLAEARARQAEREAQGQQTSQSAGFRAMAQQEKLNRINQDLQKSLNRKGGYQEFSRRADLYKDRKALQDEINQLRQEEERLRQQRRQEWSEFRANQRADRERREPQPSESDRGGADDRRYHDQELELERERARKYSEEVGLEKKKALHERAKESSKSGTLWVILAVIIMAIDLIGEPFVGYRLPTTISDIWTLLPVFTSVFFLGMIFTRFVVGLVADQFRLGMLIIYLAILHYLGNSAISLDLIEGSIVTFIIGAILIVLFFRDKNRGRTLISMDDVMYIIYAFILSLLLLNIPQWLAAGDFKAFVHIIFILLFGYMFIKPNEEDESMFHVWMAVLLFFDFLGSGFYQQANLLQYIPFLSAISIWYVAKKTQNTFAMILLFLIAAFAFFVNMTDASLQDVWGTVNLEREDAQLSAGERAESLWDKLAFWTTSRLEGATQFRGNVEDNQYEDLGVYFSNLRAAQPRFYTDEPITVWGSIRSKTYQDAVLVDFSCYQWDDGDRVEVRDVVPDQPFPVFRLEETDVECTIPQSTSSNSLGSGTHTLTFSAEYNFATNAYQKVYLMDQTRYRALIREDIDPFDQFGISDEDPRTVYTNGPVEIGMEIEPLITVSTGRVASPSLFMTLSNRENIQDSDSNVITRWDGRIKQITELVLLLPPGVDLIEYTDEEKEELRAELEEAYRLDRGARERISDEEYRELQDERAGLEEGIDDYRKCSPLPFKEYTPGQCSASCESSVQRCTETCQDNGACVQECELSGESCQEDCDFLFNGNQKTVTEGDYNAYALDTSLIEANRANLDEFRDIDRFKTFACRLVPTPDALDNTPITTSYLRLRAKYDYLTENSVQVKVEEPPYEVDVPEVDTRAPRAPSDAQPVDLNRGTYNPVVENIYNSLNFYPQGSGGHERETRYNSLILEAAKEYNIDFMIIKSMMRKESDFVPGLESSKGALGLLQIMPATADSIDCASDWDTNPASNIDCGVKYIRYLKNIHDSGSVVIDGNRLDIKEGMRHVIASYNGGPEAMAFSGDRGHEDQARWENPNNEGWSETRNYVPKVEEYYQELASQIENLVVRPDAPASISAISSDGVVEVVFEPSPSAGVREYRVTKRQQGSTSTQTLCDVPHTGSSTYSCSDSDVTVTRTYIYEVFAYGEGGTEYSQGRQASVTVSNSPTS